MSRHAVARTADVPEGGRLIAEIEGRSIGIFNLGGEFFALRNVCPHQAAPVCRGNTCGLTTSSGPGEFSYSREGEIIRCPWHHWEFDIRTGQSIFNPRTTRVRSYPTSVSSTLPEEQLETFPVSLAGDWIIVEM